MTQIPGMDSRSASGNSFGGNRPGDRLRVACCISSLAQGGAQRQMSLLAVLLARRGYDVEVLTLRPGRFFDPMVEAAGVPVRRMPLPPSGRLRRMLAARRAIHAGRPEVVIAYLGGADLYAKLAGLPWRRFGLIVSEFSFPDGALGLSRRLRLASHRLADFVVTETNTVRRTLRREARWLAGRVAVIRNGVDLAAFHPPDDRDASGQPAAGTTRVLVLAAYRAEKNAFGMLAAMEHVRRTRPAARVELDWYGATHVGDGQDRVYRAFKDAVRARGLERVFRLHGPVRDAARLYGEASVVCLPSFFEGCSNVICEAAASGVPLIVSDVCDNREFVLDGVTGLLADPHVPETFGDAILRFHDLSSEVKSEMGRRARAHAEALFDPERFADDYEALIRRVARPGRRNRGSEHRTREAPRNAGPAPPDGSRSQAR